MRLQKGNSAIFKEFNWKLKLLESYKGESRKCHSNHKGDWKLLCLVWLIGEIIHEIDELHIRWTLGLFAIVVETNIEILDRGRNW